MLVAPGNLAYAVGLIYIHILNFEIGRAYILYLRMAYIHDINATLAFWVIALQVCDILPTLFFF